jgi:hypothetical protein
MMVCNELVTARLVQKKKIELEGQAVSHKSRVGPSPGDHVIVLPFSRLVKLRLTAPPSNTVVPM